jgi:hypothetical protein
MPPELRAVRFARTRRARTRRLVTVVTLAVGIATLTVIFAFRGFRLYAPSPPGEWKSATSASAVAIGPAPSAEPPVVRVRAGTVELDGTVIDRTEGMERTTRLDGLYNALKARRAVWPGRADLPRTVIFEIDDDVPAVVVKSVVQTAAFAGFDDAKFAVGAGH